DPWVAGTEDAAALIAPSVPVLAPDPTPGPGGYGAGAHPDAGRDAPVTLTARRASARLRPGPRQRIEVKGQNGAGTRHAVPSRRSCCRQAAPFDAIGVGGSSA